MTAPLMLDGWTPSRIVRPSGIDELSHILMEEKGIVVPLGAATQQDFGNPLRGADCAIDLTGLNRITEYNPADLTIHFEAGVTLGQLKATLAENGQFLPLDPWNGPAATMGGIASTNAQGPYRAMGSIRDWIIGITVVDIAGRVSKSGGRVVKNVTGYDLAKLYTGSLGSLAIIVEISLKLRAAFGKTATAITRCTDVDTASALWSRIRQSPLQPVAAEWVGPEHAVWLRFGDNARAVDWQLKNLPAADWQIVEGPEETRLWDELAVRYREMGPGVLKVLTKPSQIQKVINHHKPEAWIAHAMNGIVLMAAGSVEHIHEVRQYYSVVVERAPLEWRRQEPAFRLQGSEFDLMLKMKNAFDPEGRLNPGRHVDGERN